MPPAVIGAGSNRRRFWSLAREEDMGVAISE
jgi:hypothetical protein